MSNELFDQAREGFLRGEVQWITPVIRVALVRGYTFNAAHKFVSDITAAGGTIHMTSPPLTNKTATNGVADADDVVFPAPSANATDHSLLVIQASAVTGGGDVATLAQRVIAWIDTATGLPIRPNGANITLTFDNGTNKIFRV